MIIDCISDLHGHYPTLEGGDLLIVAGDFTKSDSMRENFEFSEWLESQHYRKIVYIPGNHDNFAQQFWLATDDISISYLCDSGTEFQGLKIWGSPWTAYFEGMNPDCMAFTLNYGCDTEEKLAEKWALIPDNTEILVCHSPSWGLHDTVRRHGPFSHEREENVGSESLFNWISNHVNTLKLFVCGHVHEGYGVHDIRRLQQQLGDNITPAFVNASHVNERYEPVNKPIRIEL